MTTFRQCCVSSFRRVRAKRVSKCLSSAFRTCAEDNCWAQHDHGCYNYRGLFTYSPCHSFFSQSGFSAKTKEYRARKLVGFSMEQMYEVVSDVENYRTYVPFCKRSNIIKRSPGHLKAELSIGFPPVNESYVSSVTLMRPRLVKAECTEGTLFDCLVTSWRFSPGLSTEPQSCIVDFYVSFSFRSSLHSQLAHLFFNELVRQMERAFFTEAQQRFGKPSIHTLKLNQSKDVQD